MAGVIGAKMGGKRKVWYTQSTGQLGDNAPNAAKEIKVSSGWDAGRSMPSKKFGNL